MSRELPDWVLRTANRFVPSAPSPRPPTDVARLRRRVDALISGSERDTAEHGALRASLEQVEEADRGSAWLEAVILLEGAFQKRPGATFRRLGELRRRRRQEGHAAAFDDFHDTFQQVLEQSTLNAHGYQPALGAFDSHELWEGVGAITTRIGDLGHEYFATSGTLLGMVRDGRLIRHDDDVDLAVLLHASEVTEVASEWVGVRRRLADARVLDAEFEAARRPHCKVRLVGGAKVDLFPAWLSVTGQVFIWPYTMGALLREDLLPLERSVVGEAEIAVPRRPERLLEANYGPEWRTPDPTWRFDWPAARQRFSEFRAALAAAWDAPGTTS
jgi:hypothetical protein